MPAQLNMVFRKHTSILVYVWSERSFSKKWVVLLFEENVFRHM